MLDCIFPTGCTERLVVSREDRLTLMQFGERKCNTDTPSCSGRENYRNMMQFGGRKCNTDTPSCNICNEEITKKSNTGPKIARHARTRSTIAAAQFQTSAHAPSDSAEQGEHAAAYSEAATPPRAKKRRLPRPSAPSPAAPSAPVLALKPWCSAHSPRPHTARSTAPVTLTVAWGTPRRDGARMARRTRSLPRRACSALARTRSSRRTTTPPGATEHSGSAGARPPVAARSRQSPHASRHLTPVALA